MVSDNDSDMEDEHSTTEEDVSSSGGMEGENTGPQETAEESGTESKVAPKKRSGGRRAALRIVRENVEQVSKELGNFRKTHEASSKRLEKQIAALRSDIAALKSHLAKETTRVREKQDANLSRLLAKFSAPKTAKTKPTEKKKASKSKKSKGKK